MLNYFVNPLAYNFTPIHVIPGVVSRLAKVLGYRVIGNDWEPYSYTINHAYIKQNRQPAFRKLGGMGKAFHILNSLKPIKGYISAYYYPADDERPDPDRERMFYTQESRRFFMTTARTTRTIKWTPTSWPRISNAISPI